MTPASLSTMGISWVISRSAGISSSPIVSPSGSRTWSTRIGPNMPLGSSMCPWAWGWYIATACSSVVNS